MHDPCVECYNRYNRQYTSECDNTCEYAKLIKEKKLIDEELDRPIKTLGELVTQFCCITECENCPVYIHNYDKRTEYEKTCLHEPCVINLQKWVIKQSKYQKPKSKRKPLIDMISRNFKIILKSLICSTILLIGSLFIVIIINAMMEFFPIIGVIILIIILLYLGYVIGNIIGCNKEGDDNNGN